MLYLLALALAILAGVVRSRQINALMLWELRAVFLLPLALFSALLPYWLSTYSPDLIWTEDRKLLITLQLISRSLYLVFILCNVVFTARRTNWAKLLLWIQVSYLHLVQRLDRHPHRIPARPARTGSQVRDLSPLRLTGLILALPALAGQMLVLGSNQGYWPLPESYLERIEDPLLAEGIQNGALRLARLADESTRWAWLGRTIPLPFQPDHSLVPLTYISPTDLVLALALFLTLYSLFSARKKVPAPET
ncbi:MAG: hypothetical protein PHQ83_00765 [Eubacteriales bacterium]|nr:hypothetical protein [Eubacteriales bacterium]